MYFMLFYIGSKTAESLGASIRCFGTLQRLRLTKADGVGGGLTDK
jgi:hypothetical protein